LSCASIHPGQPIYRDAITILRQYQECQEWITNEPRIIPIYKKVREIGEILKYADIIDILEELRNGNPVPDRTERPYTIGDIRFIEKVFRDEFSFLFYLSLNTIFMPASYKKTFTASARLENGKLIITPEAEELFYTLGSPKERLMAILARDKEIKQWFSRWIAGIIQYRSRTSDKMSQFYDKVTRPNQNMKKESLNRNTGIKASIAVNYEEYDITQICAELDSVYDHNS